MKNINSLIENSKLIKGVVTEYADRLFYNTDYIPKGNVVRESHLRIRGTKIIIN